MWTCEVHIHIHSYWSWGIISLSLLFLRMWRMWTMMKMHWWWRCTTAILRWRWTAGVFNHSVRYFFLCGCTLSRGAVWVFIQESKIQESKDGRRMNPIALWHTSQGRKLSGEEAVVEKHWLLICWIHVQYVQYKYSIVDIFIITFNNYFQQTLDSKRLIPFKHKQHSNTKHSNTNSS